MAAPEDGEVRLEAGLHAALDDVAAGVVGAYDDARAGELLRAVERLTLEDEEAEASVRLASGAEDRHVLARLAAEVHRGADPAVRVHADHGAGVLNPPLAIISSNFAEKITT